MTIQLTKDYILAGHCIFTIKSKKTGKHFTFRVMLHDAQNGKSFRVGVLTGADTYRPIGLITRDMHRFHDITRRPQWPSVGAFEYFWRHLTERSQLAPDVEFIESGRCCCCGRTLTHPDSITKGIGPECEARFSIGGAAALDRALF